jgi:6-phosphofructokinase 1
MVATQIEKFTGFETRSIILGHLQRGGPPSAYDRVLATRLGLAASHLVIQKRFGTMVAMAGNQIVETILDEGVAATKTLDLTYYDEAAAFFK